MANEADRINAEIHEIANLAARGVLIATGNRDARVEDITTCFELAIGKWFILTKMTRLKLPIDPPL